MSLSLAKRRVLTRRYEQLLEVATERARPAIDTAWGRLASYRDEDVAGFVLDTLPTINGLRSHARSIAVGYYSAVLQIPPPPVNVAAIDTVFYAESPFITVRAALADGHTLTEAAEMGRTKGHLQVKAFTNTTARATGDEFANQANVRITGWLRSANPGACEWCQRLDGAVFPDADRGNFGHTTCKCSLEPIAE